MLTEARACDGVTRVLHGPKSAQLSPAGKDHWKSLREEKLVPGKGRRRGRRRVGGQGWWLHTVRLYFVMHEDLHSELSSMSASGAI